MPPRSRSNSPSRNRRKRTPDYQRFPRNPVINMQDIRKKLAQKRIQPTTSSPKPLFRPTNPITFTIQPRTISPTPTPYFSPTTSTSPPQSLTPSPTPYTFPTTFTSTPMAREGFELTTPSKTFAMSSWIVLVFVFFLLFLVFVSPVCSIKKTVSRRKPPNKRDR